MTIMNTELYDALTSAGANEEKARAAAESITEHRDDITLIKAKLGIIMWVLGIGFPTIFAMLIPMFWKLFSL